MIHPQRADVVRMIFKLFNGGTGVTEIARYLTGRFETPQEAMDANAGIASGAKRVPWTGAAVRRILRNPVYIGMLVDGMTQGVRDEDTYDIVGRVERPREEWRVADIPALAIVDVQVWTLAQERLNRNYDSKVVNAPWTRFILTGLVFCGSCGQPGKACVNGSKVFRCTHD